MTFISHWQGEELAYDTCMLYTRSIEIKEASQLTFIATLDSKWLISYQEARIPCWLIWSRGTAGSRFHWSLFALQSVLNPCWHRSQLAYSLSWIPAGIDPSLLTVCPESPLSENPVGLQSILNPRFHRTQLAYSLSWIPAGIEPSWLTVCPESPLA
jgi:hypothetical protein